MANDWTYEELSELSSDISYGYTESATTSKVGPHFLRITDIQNGTVDWSSVPYCPISPIDYQKYKLHIGDIVIARTGNSTGENYLYQCENDAVFASYLIRFRINQQKANPKYVWYNMRSPSWWEFINNSKTGSAQAGANARVLGRFKIKLLPLDQQNAIAHILGTLDDKIECNRRMNETLEAMARALFKAWFVDFEPVRAKLDGRWRRGQSLPGLPAHLYDLFPDRLVDSEFGQIPEGWKVAKIGTILTRLPVKTRYTKTQTSKYGPIPVFEQGASLILGYKDGVAAYTASDVDPSFIFGDHTCVTRLSFQPFDVSQNIIPLKGRNFPTTWVYYAIREKQTFEEYRRHWMELIAKITILPSVDICQEFSTLVSHFHLAIEKNERQSSSLSQLRDLLLPKLISGELPVPDLSVSLGSSS